MWRATIKGLIAHKVRLALTTLAVLLGVAFVAGTYMLTDTMNAAFDGLFQEVSRGVAVDVSGIPKFTSNLPGDQTSGDAERVPASLLDTIKAVPGVRTAEGNLGGYAQVVDKHGKAISTGGGAPTFGFAWISDPNLSAVALKEGRAPAGPGEIAIDAGTAAKAGFKVGDRTTVLVLGPPIKATIVGIVRFGSSDNLLGATLVAFDQETAQKVLDGNGSYDDILIAADPGVSPIALRDRVAKVLPAGFQAQTGQQSAEANAATIKDQLKFFNIALLVFAYISLFVGAFIIYNTFSILVTQRTRELGLMRAIGATPAQVRTSVMAEAIIVGALASAVGILAGFGIALGLQGLMKAFGVELPSTGTVILTRTIIVALIVGIGTTWVSSVMPAIRASRVPAMAALREQEPRQYRRSRRRTIIGGLVTAAGVGALLLGLFAGSGISSVGLGAAVIFIGVAILSPLVARPVAGFVGAPLARVFRVPGKLGRENAMRNPRRTASTASALMIGLALLAFVSIFGASIKASTDRILEDTLKADYLVTTGQQAQGFSQDVAAQMRSSGVFSAVEEVRFGAFGYQGRAHNIVGLDPSLVTDVAQVKMISGNLSALSDGDLLVDRDAARKNGWTVGDVIPVQFARTGAQQLRVVGVFENNQLLGSYVVTLGTFERNFTQQLDTFLLAKTAPGVSGADAAATVKRLGKQFPNVQIQNQAEFRRSTGQQIDRLLGLVTALLLLSLVIAVFGIINTLALSVFERTREIGLLRAVGLSRRQTRAMVRWEAVIIAVFGAILGMAVGVFFGWAIVQALSSQGISVFSIPGGQLVLYLILAALFGVLAALYPARKAARLNILEAIATE